MARYPEEFSYQACNRIDKAKFEAHRELQRCREAPPEPFTVALFDRFALIQYIFTVVFAFAAEARKCVRQSIWTIARANEELKKFAGAFAYETSEGEEGYDRLGQLIAPLTTFTGRDFLLRPEIERELYKTPEWQDHVEELLAVVDFPVIPESEQPSTPPQPTTEVSTPKSRRGRPEGRPIDGQKLRQLREEMNLSQADLAEKCEPQLSEDTIQRAERGGAVDPKTVDTLVKVLIDLGCSKSTAEAIRKPQ